MVEDIHLIWSIRELIQKIGPHRTIRELKTRCEAGAIIGCSLYMGLCLKWIEVSLTSTEPAERGPAEEFLEAAGEDKYVQKIEELHTKHPPKTGAKGVVSGIPRSIQYDILDEFERDMEMRAGRRIPRDPNEASRDDIQHSKEVVRALARGEKAIIEKQKPHPPGAEDRVPGIPKPVEIPTPKPKPTESERRIDVLRREKEERERRKSQGEKGEREEKKEEQEEPEPEKAPKLEQKLDLMEDEIRRRIEEIKKRRASGEPTAGETEAEYIKKKNSYHMVTEDPADIGDLDEWITSKGASFLDEVRGSHHGQIDATLTVRRGDDTIGYIDYSIFEGKVYLDLIYVVPEHRRQGYATALMLELKQLNPGMPVEWGMMTESGYELKQKEESDAEFAERTGHYSFRIKVGNEWTFNCKGSEIKFRDETGEFEEIYNNYIYYKRTVAKAKREGAKELTINHLKEEVKKFEKQYVEFLKAMATAVNPNPNPNPIKKFTESDARRIGKKLNIDFSKIPIDQFVEGLNIELEHADVTGADELTTARIALAHLQERCDYYELLKKVEQAPEPAECLNKQYQIKETDDQIIEQIKKEQGNLKGLKCTTIKSFHKLGYTVVVMRPYQEGEGLGSMGSVSLYDINFKEEHSAKRLEAKLKSLFASYNTVDIKNIQEIKKAALEGADKIWVRKGDREGLILASKYGKTWWEKADQEDIERIAVYEKGEGYGTLPEPDDGDMQTIYLRGQQDAVNKLGSDINDYTKVVYGLEAVLRSRGIKTAWDDIAHWWHMPLAMIPANKPLDYVAKMMEGQMQTYLKDSDSYDTTHAISLQDVSWRIGRLESARSHDPGQDVDGILEYNIKNKYPGIRKGSKQWKAEVAKIGDKALQLAIRNKEEKVTQEVSELRDYYEKTAKQKIEKARRTGKSLEYRADIIQALIPESPTIKQARDEAEKIYKKVNEYERYLKKYLNLDSDELKIGEGYSVKDPADNTLVGMSYAELHFIISTCQDIEKLKKLHARAGILTQLTEFDIELIKEEISQRIQHIMELEEMVGPVILPAPAQPAEKRYQKTIQAKKIFVSTKYRTWKYSDYEHVMFNSVNIDELYTLMDAVYVSRVLTQPEKEKLRLRMRERIRVLKGELVAEAGNGKVSDPARARTYTKEERIAMAKAIASTVKKTTSEEEGETCIDLGDISNLSKEERLRLAKKIASGETEVKSTLLKDPDSDYNAWGYGEFENLIMGTDSAEDLEELGEYIDVSNGLTDREKQDLRNLIKTQTKGA